jgi:hypothetical protein
MTFRGQRGAEEAVHNLTSDWGSRKSVALYLDRCQVDTPNDVVRLLWAQVRSRRPKIGLAIDFGAGDGRFAQFGNFKEYVGYEIDRARTGTGVLPHNARLKHKCAFSDEITSADLCLGNPPFVRNQELPVGWRQRAARILEERTGVEVSGLANAWLYFFLLSLVSTRPNGLIALVVPFEWVSRPSSAALRNYIKKKGWSVSVYRLRDDTFSRVLTTSSITIVDKRATAGKWEYFEQGADDCFKPMPSPTGSRRNVIKYAGGYRGDTRPKIFAKRGLSPGSQEVLTLTEGERVRHGLRVDIDVVACVTSLRPVAKSKLSLTESVFKKEYMLAGRKCWLIRTDREPTAVLAGYLAGVSSRARKTATCVERALWWKFLMPDIPTLLVSTGFRGDAPKIVVNTFKVHAVGGVSGVYGLTHRYQMQYARALRNMNVADGLVSHSHGLRKLEINQLNSLLARLTSKNR